MRHDRQLTIRDSLLAVLAALVLADLTPATRVQAQSVLVDHTVAAQHGLERAWFAQVPLDPSRTRATAWLLQDDRVYCVTDAGIIASLDAETGAQVWSRQVGRPGAPAFGPDANDRFPGVVTGNELYMLDRDTGRLKWRRKLGSAPSSGPALSGEYAFVALVTGRVEGYDLDDPTVQPWYFHSRGRTHLRPTTTGDVVSWPTTEGYLYVSRADNPGVQFRLQTNADIVTSPAELPPYIFIASMDGYLYCLNEGTGRELWRHATGYPIMSSPAIVGEHVYVASVEPTLHCLNSKTGQLLWKAPGVSHFAAEGKDRVFAADEFGNLIIIDTATGTLLGRLPTAEGVSALVNDKTDRIMLVNDRGLVQCLREIGAVQPTLHRPPVKPPGEGETETTEGGNPFEEEGAPAEGTPFEAEGAEAEEPAEVAEPAAEAQPAEEAVPAEEGNPFGDF
jgi:outer membrane protein assembly factor BamB